MPEFVAPQKNSGAWKTKPTKVRVLNLRTREHLTMMYNPETLVIQEEPEWSEINIPGGGDSYYQFINGGSLTVPMTFFLNEWGEGGRLEAEKGYVEKAIRFLQEAKYPRPLTYGGRIVKTAPDLLRIFWGQVKFGEIDPRTQLVSPAPGLNVIVASLSVERSVFDSETGEALRAMVDVEFRRFTFV